MDFEIFDWDTMYNQAERRHWQDIEDQRRGLENRLMSSEIERNHAETALIKKQLERIQLAEEEEKRLAYERWIRSPAGQAYIKKYNDRQYFVREKTFNFLFKRPYNLLARKNLQSITYKNYISVIFWIFILASSFSFNPSKNFGIFESLFLPIFLAIVMAIVLTLIFYVIYFEILYFFSH
jgi:hypothetical protein